MENKIQLKYLLETSVICKLIDKYQNNKDKDMPKA